MCRVVMSQHKKDRLKQIGKECRDIRINYGYTQEQVAKELGENVNNISCFERGESNSAIILLWYIGHGYLGY